MSGCLGSKVQLGRRPSPQNYVNNLKVCELEVLLKKCAGIGYEKIRSEVMWIAQCVAEEKLLSSTHGSCSARVIYLQEEVIENLSVQEIFLSQ